MSPIQTQENYIYLQYNLLYNLRKRSRKTAKNGSTAEMSVRFGFFKSKNSHKLNEIN